MSEKHEKQSVNAGARRHLAAMVYERTRDNSAATSHAVFTVGVAIISWRDGRKMRAVSRRSSTWGSAPCSVGIFSGIRPDWHVATWRRSGYPGLGPIYGQFRAEAEYICASPDSVRSSATASSTKSRLLMGELSAETGRRIRRRRGVDHK